MMAQPQVDPYIDFDQPSAEDKRDMPERIYRRPMKRTGVRNKGRRR